MYEYLKRSEASQLSVLVQIPTEYARVERHGPHCIQEEDIHLVDIEEVFAIVPTLHQQEMAFDNVESEAEEEIVSYVLENNEEVEDITELVEEEKNKRGFDRSLEGYSAKKYNSIPFKTVNPFRDRNTSSCEEDEVSDCLMFDEQVLINNNKLEFNISADDGVWVNVLTLIPRIQCLKFMQVSKLFYMIHRKYVVHRPYVSVFMTLNDYGVSVRMPELLQYAEDNILSKVIKDYCIHPTFFMYLMESMIISIGFTAGLGALGIKKRKYDGGRPGLLLVFYCASVIYRSRYKRLYSLAFFYDLISMVKDHKHALPLLLTHVVTEYTFGRIRRYLTIVDTSFKSDSKSMVGRIDDNMDTILEEAGLLNFFKYNTLALNGIDNREFKM